MSISSSGLARTVRVAASAATALAVLITPIAPAFAQDASSTPDTGTASSTEPTISTLDTTAPVITLNGDATVNLSVGDTWTDPSATATDDIDGTDPVAIGGDTVDTKTAGTYVITYDAADKAGNSATQVTRTVVVSAASDDTASTTDDNSGGGPKGGIKTFSLFSAPLLATTSAPAISGFTQDGNTLACGTTTDTNGTSPNTTHMQWTESSSGIQQYEIFPTYPDGIGEHQYFVPGTALDVWIGDNFTHHGEGTYSYVIRAQGSDGSWSDNSASCSLTYSTTPPPPVPPTPATVVVSPSAMNGWYFYNDLSGSVLTPDADHGFTTGPGTPPLGTGSAHFTKTTTDRYGIATPQFAGTPLADITALSFSTYRTNGTSAQASSLGFDIDSDTTDGDTSYQGRLTYEPYFTQTVDTGAWRNWNTLDDSAGTGTGNWWFSHATLSGGAASQCTQSNPCTWSELLHDYPHASMRSPGQLILRTNGADGEAFDGNVDDLHIATANADTTYNFDPDAVVAPTPSVTTDAATGISDSDATLNGTNGPVSAQEESFWVSTSTIDTSSPNIPAGVYSTPVLSGVGAGASFSDPLSLVTTNGIVTGGASGNMPAITPNTTYYYVAWANVGGTWYPGAVQSFTTTSAADTEAPVVTVTPDSTTVLHGSETFTITVSDNKPLDPSKNTHVWVYLYNNLPPQAGKGATLDLSSGTATFTVDTTQLANGTSTLDVGRVEDAAGNWSGTGDNYFGNYVIQNYAYDAADSRFTANPEYVRANNSGDTAAIALVPAQATAARYTYTQTDGSNVYANVPGTEHIQAGQFPVPSTGQHQYRGGVSAAEGVYTVTGEYEVGGTWYPITGSATLYALGLPTGDFIIPSASSSIFRPSDNPLRVEAADANDTFRDVVFNVDGTNYQVNRADCDLREAGHRVLCDVSSASNWAGLAPGTYTATATLYNLASNHAAITSQSFTVSDSVPTVTNFQVVPGSVASSSISVSADATDPTGIKDVDFYITAPRAGDGVCDGNGTKLADSDQTSGTGSTYTATLDTSALSGKYCVNVVAGNLAATHSHPQSLAVTVDTTAPSVPTNGLPNGTATSTNDFYFTWDASTDDSGDPVTYLFQSSQNPAETGGVLTSGLWTSGTLTGPTIHSTGAHDGTWYWQVRAQDAAGNWSAWSPIWSMTIDTTGPAQPVITSPADGSTLTTATWNDVTWTDVSDSGTPITYVYQSATDPSTNPDGSFTNPAYTSGTLATTSQPTPGTAAGTYYVHVKATDAAGNSAWSDPIEVIVDNTSGAGHPTNTAPVADDQSVSVGENGTLGIVLTGSDADGDTLSFATTSSPAHGTLTGSAPNLTYTPNTGFTGTDSFTFTTNDGALDSAPATVTVTVNAADSSVPSGTFVITPSAMQGWATSTATGAGTDFVTDDTSPNGVGALQLSTGADNESVAHMTSPSFNMPLADVSSLSYATKVVAVPDAQKAVGNATLRVMIDTTGDGVADDELMYEPYYNGFDGTTMTGWQTWAITPSSGKFWSNETNSYNSLGGVGAGSYASNFTLADVLHDYPNAHVVGLVLSMGTWNDSQTVEADNLQINGTTQYSFEPDAAPSNGNGGGSVQPLFFSRGSSGSGGSSGQTINSGGGEVLGASTYNFTRDLHLGSTGDDVVALQQFLISSGYPISAGATGYFGLQTQAALAKFQSDHGITPALGYFGPITRALVNSGTIETTPVTQNQESVQQQIADLLAKLAALRAQLNAASTTP